MHYIIIFVFIVVCQRKRIIIGVTVIVFACGNPVTEHFEYKKQQFELEDLCVMSLQLIRNLNLFETLVTGYIGMMSCEKEDTIFMLELKECSKRIFDIPKFIFYGLGYAIERVLARTHSGIKGFLLKKEQSQQLTLAECFAGLGFE